MSEVRYKGLLCGSKYRKEGRWTKEEVHEEARTKGISTVGKTMDIICLELIKLERQEKLRQDKQEIQRQRLEKQERQRLEKQQKQRWEKQERQRSEKREKQRLEKQERQRLEKQQKQRWEKQERQRLEKQERQRLEKQQKQERQRLEKQEKIEKQRLEEEQIMSTFNKPVSTVTINQTDIIIRETENELREIEVKLNELKMKDESFRDKLAVAQANLAFDEKNYNAETLRNPSRPHLLEKHLKYMTNSQNLIERIKTNMSKISSDIINMEEQYKNTYARLLRLRNPMISDKQINIEVKKLLLDKLIQRLIQRRDKARKALSIAQQAYANNPTDDIRKLMNKADATLTSYDNLIEKKKIEFLMINT